MEVLPALGTFDIFFVKTFLQKRQKICKNFLQKIIYFYKFFCKKSEFLQILIEFLQKILDIYKKSCKNK